jgi:hypothetical protein
MRQPVTLDVCTLEQMVIDLAQELTLEKFGVLQELIKLLQKYHSLCLDKNINKHKSIWFEYYKNIFASLNNTNHYRYGYIIKKEIDSTINDLLMRYGLHINSISEEIGNVCLEIAEKSSSRIILTDKILKNKRLKSYTIKEFNGRNDRSVNLLRNIKECSFEEGEDIEQFRFLEPYLMYATKIEIFDKFIFTEAEDYQIIALLCSQVLDLKKIIVRTKQCDYKNDRTVKNNYEWLKRRYPDTNVEYYRNHKRRILTEYSQIILDASLNNIKSNNGERYFVKEGMTFIASLYQTDSF